MTNCLLRRIAIVIGIIGACAAPAQAATTEVDTSMCSAPALTQAFQSWSDTNWYALASGQTPDNFNGTGWTLSGGAKVVTAQLADGRTGSVLDLPSGSQAVSPTLCVASDYPTARTMVRNLSGNNGGNVAFSVSYAGTSSANSPYQTSSFKSTSSSVLQGASGNWNLGQPVQLDPGTVSGWQPMRIVLQPSGSNKSEFQVYNLYLDPRARG
jgi:hypothetical protein